MKKLITTFLLSTFFATTPVLAHKKDIITVNQFVSHVALDEAYAGLVKAIEEGGMQDKVEIILGNAQGNISNAVQIAKHHASLDPHFMIAIATPAAQATFKAMPENAIFGFLAVTDPKGANLAGKENVMGVSDSPPIDELVELLPTIFKDLRRIGVLYNAGEINSVKMVEQLEKLASSKKIELVESVVNNTSDIMNGMGALIGKVDLIYIPQDNTVVAAIDSVTRIAAKNKIALVANDPTLTDKGVMLALGTNYFKSGHQLGGMIIDILNGKEVSPKIQKTSKFELRINEKVAADLEITIDESLKNEANSSK